jgi:hypothetical protein
MAPRNPWGGFLFSDNLHQPVFVQFGSLLRRLSSMYDSFAICQFRLAMTMGCVLKASKETSGDEFDCGDFNRFFIAPLERW